MPGKNPKKEKRAKNSKITITPLTFSGVLKKPLRVRAEFSSRLAEIEEK